MKLNQVIQNDFERNGRLWLRDTVSEADLSLLDTAASVSQKAGQRLKTSEALAAALSDEGAILTAIRTLDPNAKPIRVAAFNKSDQANWGVPWHQDRVIAVDQHAEVAGYHNWTTKSEIWHCEPPQDILDHMLFVRIHLDD